MVATVCRQIVKWLFVTAVVYSPSKCKVFYQKRLLAKFLRRKHVLFKKQATSFFLTELAHMAMFWFLFFQFFEKFGGFDVPPSLGRFYNFNMSSGKSVYYESDSLIFRISRQNFLTNKKNRLIFFLLWPTLSKPDPKTDNIGIWT